MITATHLLAHKPSDVWAVSPEHSVYEAIALMADKGIGALLVMRDKQLCGILSERDYARKVILRGKESRNTCVGEIMTANVITVGPADDVDHCLSIMTEHRIRHLPVVERDRVVGVLSIGDLVKAKIADQQAVIEQLETYITS